jgi:hypothetical protein
MRFRRTPVYPNYNPTYPKPLNNSFPLKITPKPLRTTPRKTLCSLIIQKILRKTPNKPECSYNNPKNNPNNNNPEHPKTPRTPITLIAIITPRTLAITKNP